MTQIEADLLQTHPQFQLLVELRHAEVAPFVADYYWRKRSWVTWAHYGLSLGLMVAWLAAGLRQRASWDNWLTTFGSGVLAFVVLIPIHEWIHGAVYKLWGAADVRYGVSLRRFYAYALAHRFVADQREFAWVALAPFLAITILLVGAAAAGVWPFFMLGVALVHTAGTSGDFAMLNYLWLTRHQAVYTYDDADTHTSYFYARQAG